MRAARLSISACLATTVCLAPALADDVTVFAAASLTEALDRIAAQWSGETGHRAVMSYAGSSALARQIQEGAPADIFISASADWMDEVAASGDIRAESRRVLLGNRLVLIAHGEAEPATIDETLDLPALLDGGRLSMAMVNSVPAGIYGRQALMNLGLWDQVEPMIAQSDNVRAALAFVAQGEAPLGIVYGTDAAVQDHVTVIGTFPETSHGPITYAAAITTGSESTEAAAFLDYLGSPSAQPIWAEFGFTIPQ